MGTGEPPSYFHQYIFTKIIYFQVLWKQDNAIYFIKFLGLNPQSISTGLLNVSLHFHFQPINHVVFMGFYLLIAMGKLILEGASRLDAFSVYPFRT